jgi:hypothetical protein
VERDGVKRWQDSIVLAVMLVVLVVGTTGVYFASPKPGNSGPALSTYSSDPGGAMAFHRWLGDLGFDVTTIEDDPFFLPDDVNALIVLTDQTTLSYSASEARTLAGWIGRGHLALVGTDTIGQPSLMQALGLRVVPQGGATLRAPVQPLLLYPPVHSVSDVPALGLEGNDDFVGLIPASGQRGYLFLTKRIGSGALYVCSAPKLFSNQLIVEEDNRLLALNFIGAESPGARLAFDEYHHNYIHRRSQSLTTVIVSAFWGRAVLLVLFAGFVYIGLTGRRLGRPVSGYIAGRRTLREYIVALAGLYRRAGVRIEVQRRYQRRLRVLLADRYHVARTVGDRALAEVATEMGASPEIGRRVMHVLEAAPTETEDALLALARNESGLEEALRK